MPSTDIKLELKAKTSMAQTAPQVAVYAKGLTTWRLAKIKKVKFTLKPVVKFQRGVEV
jgi:hypothetical protein